MINKQRELDKIAEQIRTCRVCRKDKIGVAVPGEGNPNADIVFIGEAPGKQEAKEGRPFIGRSGKYLRALINGIGLDDLKDVYITSPVKYLPKHGTPTPQEVAHGRKHLFDQFNVIQPRLIVLMGSVAALAILEKKIPTMQHHGEVIEHDGRKYFLTIHPAAAIRFFKFRKVIESDFKLLEKIAKI